MSINVIRRADAEDTRRVTAAAERFCNRHSIYFDADFTAETAIDYELEQSVDITSEATRDYRAHLKQLWTRAFCRALYQPYNSRLTIAYGHVGTRAD